jgi:ubiquitin C-terminal hydrolase
MSLETSPQQKSESNMFEKYKKNGYTGLANIGNSCYINACMQILSHTYEFSDFLDDENYKKKINKVSDSVILLEWDKLREMIWDNNCTIAPWGFVKAVQRVAALKDNSIFTGSGQNDIQEYLLFMIDCFHNAIRREVDMEITGKALNETDRLATTCYKMMQTSYKKDYSEILDIFYGIQVSEIVSVATNESLSLLAESFSVLSLPIPNRRGPTLMDCFGEYCKKERLDGDNAWYNDETKEHEEVTKGYIFWSLPTILIIDLKRWGADGRKIHKVITTELESIDFSPFVKGYNSGSYVYDLYGVCNHSGGSAGGHYTAHIKTADNRWYEFDDTSIREIKTNQVISSRSYCFFFRKKK